MPRVGLAAGGVCLKPGVEPLAGELAHQHHGVGDQAVGAVGVGHAVQRDGRLVQVALPVDAGGVDELLVIGDALGRLQILVEEGADGPEVDVNDAVGLGQQPRGFRRGFGAQEDGHGQKKQDRGHNEERSARASVHGAVRNTLTPREECFVDSAHSGKIRGNAERFGYVREPLIAGPQQGGGMDEARGDKMRID